MKVTGVIVVDLDIDDPGEGDTETERARDVLRGFGEGVRHTLLAAGVRVGNVASVLTTDIPSTTP